MNNKKLIANYIKHNQRFKSKYNEDKLHFNKDLMGCPLYYMNLGDVEKAVAFLIKEIYRLQNKDTDHDN
jgi:hypothetical protein